MSILSWNINGFSDSKIFLHSFDRFFQQFDLILLQETRCTHVGSNSLPGFKIFTTPSELSSNKRGYGLIVAVKETTLFGAQLCSITSSSLWVCLRFRGDIHPAIYIGNVYIPPIGSPLLSANDLDWRFGELSGKIHEFEGDISHVFMGGDFNGNVEYASSSTAPGQGIHVGQNRGGKLMVKLAAETSLSICTGRVAGDLDMAATYKSTQ
jgi:exonuclease III